MLGFFLKKITQIFRFFEESPTLKQHGEAVEQFGSNESDDLLSLEDELRQIANDERHFDLELVASLEQDTSDSSVVTDEHMQELIAADRPEKNRKVQAQQSYKTLPKIKTASLTKSQNSNLQSISHVSINFVSNSSQSRSAPADAQVKGQTNQVEATQEQVTHRLVEYNQAVPPQRSKAIKTLKVHGLRSLNKSKNRRKSSLTQSSDLILSRSKMNEVQTHPQESVTHRAEKPTQDQARLKELEHNLEYATNKAEQTWQAEESNISPKLLKELSQHKSSTTESSASSQDQGINQQIGVELSELPPPEAHKVQDKKRPQSKDRQQAKPKADPPSSEDKTARRGIAEISMLGDPVNQNLADFARDRYIDYDKVLTAHIKKKP